MFRSVGDGTLGTINRTTDETSGLLVTSGSMPFSNLGVVCMLEFSGTLTQPSQQIVGSCFFDNMIFVDGSNNVDVEWEAFRQPDAANDVLPIHDFSHYDDSWTSILTSNPDDHWVDITVDLQGDNRPIPGGWQVPIDVGFYPPNSDDDTLLNPGSAIYYFSGTTHFYGSKPVFNPSTRAYYHCPAQVNSGNYDITVDSTTTLLNVKREVYVP